MEQGKQQTADKVGHHPAFALQVAEHQSPEQHLLHKGGQENDDQQRHPGRIVDLGGDGGVVQVGVVVHQQPGQAVHQLIEAVQGHKAHGHGSTGIAQVVCKVPGGAGQEAVENNQGSGKQGVIVDGVLQGRGDGGVQQARHQAEQGRCGKGQHHQVDDEENGSGDLLAGGHIGGGFTFGHCKAPLNGSP